MYFLWHFRLIFSGCLHFPFDFRRAWLLFCDFPAFPSVCPLFSPAVLRLQSHLRCGILLAHHGYTGQQRYGQAKSAHEMGKRFAYPFRKSPTPIVQDEKRTQSDPKNARYRISPKRERKPRRKSQKRQRLLPPLNDSAPPPPNPQSQTLLRKRIAPIGQHPDLYPAITPRRRLDTEETASSP